MSVGVTTIGLTAAQLTYLAALEGATELAGIDDPFSGLLADEAEQALRQARDSLVNAGLISTGPDGAIVLSPEVQGLVRTIAHARTVIMLGRTGHQTHSFYLRGRAQAELMPGDHQLVEVAALASPEVVARRIMELLTRQTAAPEGTVRLPHAGLPTDLAAAVKTSASLVRLTWQQQGWEASGLGFLQSEDRLWRLDSAPGGEGLRATPCSFADAEAAVFRMVLDPSM